MEIGCDGSVKIVVIKGGREAGPSSMRLVEC